MLRIMGKDKKTEVRTLTNPSAEDVQNLIDAMDNDLHPGFVLLLPSGDFSVWGGNQNRVGLFFSGGTKDQRSGRLLDPTFSREDGRIDMSAQGEVNPEFLMETVTKEAAKQVVVYFLSHGDVPEGLLWKENMTKTP